MPAWSEPYLLFLSIVCFALLVGRYWVWIEKKEDRGEKLLGRYLRADMLRPMGGWEYLTALMLLTVGGGLFIFVVVLLQGILPLNPVGVPGLTLLQAAHLAISAATHTNWQPFAPEATYSILTQMVAVNTTNLIQDGVGIAVMRALVRALTRQEIGNAWGAVFRGCIWLILPFHIIGAIFLMLNGVPQNPFAEQYALGPVASFSALKVISGGAGYFSQNFASIIANPNRLTNFWGTVEFVAFPLGVFWGAGRVLKHPISTELLGLASLGMLFVFAIVSIPTELPTDRYSPLTQSLWLNATSGNSNGALSTSFERFAPSERLSAFFLVMGGIPFPPPVGFGVAMVLFFLILALYLGGLMVGRTPVMWGYRLTLRILALALVGLMANQVLMLIATSLVYLSPDAVAFMREHGPYGSSVILHTIATAVQNNGSAYSLAITNEAFLHMSMVLMVLGRFFVLAPAVVVASEFLKQKNDPQMPTVIAPCSPLIIGLWLVLIVFGALLAFAPLMMLGPVWEGLP